MEDGAAVAGLFLAGAAVGMTHYTGSVLYDALGSITIGGKSLPSAITGAAIVKSVSL